MNTNQTQCPICNTILESTQQSFSLDNLFVMWHPILHFPQDIIEQHRTQANQTTLYQCANCELGVFLPAIIGTPEFYEAFGQKTEIYYEREGRWEFKFAVEDTQDAKQIIEIGFGTGVFMENIRKHVDRAVGLEYNTHALSAAKEKGLEVYNLNNQDSLSALHGKFDVAYAFQVLEHVPDPMSFIRECASWVKPGGSIVFAVPNSGGIIKHYKEDFYNYPPHHATRWTPHTLKTAATVLGYEVGTFGYQPLEQAHFDFLIHWWNDTFKNLKPIQWLGTRIMSRLVRVLQKFNVRQLPIHGHTIYIRMIKPG